MPDGPRISASALPQQRTDWPARVGALRQWAQGGERAPHKPLLLLYALGRFQRDGGLELRYSEVEADLKRLLADFGPNRRTSPAYPFHHLVGDGVWEVRTDAGPGSPGALVGALRAGRAAGRLAPGLREALRHEPGLLGQLARVLLDRHFAPSLHADLADGVGLVLEAGGPVPHGRAEVRRRDAEMRALVLDAYENRCAFCGFDGALGGSVPVGLEAAHVRWWAFAGPDVVSNGLCLCSLHHRLFDRGVLGLTEERRITVSRRFTGRSEAARVQVLELGGRALLGPRAGGAPVAGEHIVWHTRQVFRGS
ncbi:HNH endonuclease [Streptomyces sp. AV19]|uniref:phosphorothioated DNA-binding restriction endonuclease n=1 Tax=Streptomyces sp. AV19 TaxID=2793068 RepID=UPI0018FE48B4|nr:HNH endonuclease [Streptomyces sp. AV19]MBH1933033.1 HNH endonuclease [Streptomyces sp. AV19]MDG4531746.1 HNH endonuclease [Streptomyces sp. AV19]